MDFAKFWSRLRRAIASLAPVVSGAALAPALAWPQAGVESEPVLGPVEFLERFVTEVDDFSASFEQELFNADGELEEASSGRFSLLRPDRFAWHYDTPYEYIVVADGELLWMHDVDIEQVTCSALSDLSASPAMLLSGEGTVSDGFVVNDAGSEDGRRWIELLPIEGDGEFDSVRIGFRGSVPQALELVDGLSQLTRIEFRDVEVDTGLRRRDFEFDLPRGVDVVGDC